MRKYYAKAVGFTLVAVFVIAASTIAASAGTVLSDSTFSSVTDVPSGGFVPTGDTLSTTVCANCGNPSGPGLQAVITNNSYAGTNNAGIGVLDNALTYNPSTQGSIISMNAFADKETTVSSGSLPSTAFRILLEQDATITQMPSIREHPRAAIRLSVELA
jgi:hypothetical protein